MAFSLKLQPSSGSPACWSTLLVLYLPSLHNHVIQFLEMHLSAPTLHTHTHTHTHTHIHNTVVFLSPENLELYKDAGRILCKRRDPMLEGHYLHCKILPMSCVHSGPQLSLQNVVRGWPRGSPGFSQLRLWGRGPSMQTGCMAVSPASKSLCAFPR